MKINYLLPIYALIGFNFIAALPSHSQPRNQCKAALTATTSNITRKIRVEKYGIAFDIPENYRTRSNITESSIVIDVFNPEAYEYDECLKRTKEPTEGALPSAFVKIYSASSKKSLIDIAKADRFVSNFRKTTFKNKPAIGFESSLLGDYFYDNVLFFISGRKFFVTISVLMEDKALGDIVKSSFTFLN